MNVLPFIGTKHAEGRLVSRHNGQPHDPATARCLVYCHQVASILGPPLIFNARPLTLCFSIINMEIRREPRLFLCRQRWLLAGRPGLERRWSCSGIWVFYHGVSAAQRQNKQAGHDGKVKILLYCLMILPFNMHVGSGKPTIPERCRHTTRFLHLPISWSASCPGTEATDCLGSSLFQTHPPFHKTLLVFGCQPMTAYVTFVAGT